MTGRGRSVSNAPGRDYNSGVSSRLVKVAILLLVLICLWGHVAEIFDHWDQTLQTGSDSEYSLVLLALSTGAVLVLAERLPIVGLSPSAQTRADAAVRILPAQSPFLLPVTDASPHLSLRI